MLIEYTIKYEGGGLTITQRVDPCGTVGTTRPPVVIRNPNGKGVDLGVESPASPSAQDTGAANTIASETSAVDGKLGEGGGEGDRTGPGGMPPGGLVIVFGPVVCVGCPLGPGGGEGDKTDPGGEPDRTTTHG